MPVDAVLFSEMTPQPEWEARFNRWYDEEHIPLRMRVPGFIGAQRYMNTEAGRGYLAIYDMTAPDVLVSEAYRAVKDNPSDETAWMLRSVGGFTRYIGALNGWQTRPDVDEARLLAAPYAYSVMFTVPSAREVEFNDWYASEHVPLLLGNADWLGCRRYRIVDGGPEAHTHLAIHHLNDLAALEGPQRAQARATQWRDRLAREPWFKGRYATFRKVGGRFSGLATPGAS